MPLQPISSQFGEAGDDIDLADIGRTLLRRWRRIAFVTLITTLIAIHNVLFSTPHFTMSGTFYLGDAQSNQNNTSEGTNFLSDYQTINSVNTQIQLIQSKALLEQAILETGLNVSIRPVGQTSMSFWKWRFLHGASIQAFAPGPADLTALFATIADPGSPGATFTLRFGPGGSYQLFGAGGFLSSDKPVLTGIWGQLAASGGISLLIKSLSNSPPPPPGSRYTLSVVPAKAMADNIAGGLTVSAGGSATAPTNVATVRFVWHDPYQGKAFVDQLMQDFIRTQLSWQTESASNTEQFIAAQLQKISASLAAADKNLAAYEAQTGIVDVPTNAQAVINQLSQYQLQRTAILLQQESLQQMVRATGGRAKDLNPYLLSQANDPVLAQLSGSLANAQVQLQTLLVQFTQDAPEVHAQRATISKIENAIRALIVNDESLVTRNLADIDRMIGKYEDQLKSMPSESLQVIDLTRSSDVFGQLYILLMQKEEEAEVSKAATIINTRIVTPAEIPLYATSPKGKIIILTGFLLGLLAGTAIVLAQRAISGRFGSDDDVRRAAVLPIYGSIPNRPAADARNSIFPLRSSGPFSEAFRLLRGGLYQSAASETSYVVLITSAAIADGKTMVAANLAKVLADDGRRVLLIDADMHRGHAHEALNIAQAPGMAEWLATKKKPLLQAVAQQKFAALSAGTFPANPSELLNQPQLADIFKILRSKYEFIIIDGPPLPAVSDSLTLAKYADHIVSVVRIDHTARRDFADHIEMIGNRDTHHGIVINGVFGKGRAYASGAGRNESYGDWRPHNLFPRLLKTTRDLISRRRQNNLES